MIACSLECECLVRGFAAGGLEAVVQEWKHDRVSAKTGSGMCSGQNLYSEVKLLGLLSDHVHTQGRVALEHLHKPPLIQCVHMYIQGL